jgi:hypothetical protein
MTPRGLSVASWASDTAMARRVCASAGAGSTHHDQSSSSGRVKRTGSSSPSGRVRRSRSRKAKFPRGLCERPREEGRGNRSVDRPLSTTRRSTNIAIATGVSRRSSSDAESSQARSAIRARETRTRNPPVVALNALRAAPPRLRLGIGGLGRSLSRVKSVRSVKHREGSTLALEFAFEGFEVIHTVTSTNVYS